jgi:hypothetical protein
MSWFLCTLRRQARREKPLPSFKGLLLDYAFCRRMKMPETVLARVKEDKL